MKDQCRKDMKHNEPSQRIANKINVIGVILKAVKRQWLPCLLQIPMDIVGQIHRRRRKIYHTTADKTYSSNESPPREVNLIVSMHSSALFMVAIE